MLLDELALFWYLRRFLCWCVVRSTRLLRFRFLLRSYEGPFWLFHVCTSHIVRTSRKLLSLLVPSTILIWYSLCVLQRSIVNFLATYHQSRDLDFRMSCRWYIQLMKLTWVQQRKKGKGREKGRKARTKHGYAEARKQRDVVVITLNTWRYCAFAVYRQNVEKGRRRRGRQEGMDGGGRVIKAK
jgi:hypothetical protein